jgi:hypothetical protein
MALRNVGNGQGASSSLGRCETSAPAHEIGKLFRTYS